MGTSLKDLDPFVTPPFIGLKNAGYYNQTKAWEWFSDCNYACFYCVTRGGLSILDGDRETVVQEGDTLFLRSTDKVLMQCTDPVGCAYYFISFYYDETCDLMIDTVVKNAAVANLFREIYEARHSASPIGHFNLYTRFVRLIYLLALKTLKSSKEYKHTCHVESAAEYINMNYNKKITIDELCRISGYSPAHLRRLFLKHYAVSPAEYILKRRIEMAKEMLLDMPAKSIEEIAEALGFCSSSYFCKLFKQQVGLSPLAYKAKYNA